VFSDENFLERLTAMAYIANEPSRVEIGLTLGLGLTILSPYYRAFVDSLNFYGHERVLDFGSGSGVCSRHIAARLHKGGGHLDCVDISPGWMQVSRRTLWHHQNVSFHLGDIQSLHLLEDAYDAVVVHFVLHDIPKSDRRRIITALVDRLKPSGRLLLREPLGYGLERNELAEIARASSLHIASLVEHQVAIGPVLDGNFIDIQPPRFVSKLQTESITMQPVAC
jgi:SAM-dependent methyltransferase